MIAASKMRRAQEMARRGRPYSERLRDLLADLAAQTHDEEDIHPLLRRREPKNVALVLITPDRGLTGGLHTSLNRAGGRYLIEQDGEKTVFAVGRKGRDFMVRTGQNVKAVFTGLGDRPTLADVTPLARLVIEDYEAENIDAVHVIYGDFISTTVQRPVTTTLLPVVPAELDPAKAVGYIYEPDSQHVLSALLPRFVEMQLYHAVLEAVASEQSARMVAMQTATDNANEMVQDLTLVMNKARQEMITKELLDIVGGAAAVEA